MAVEFRLLGDVEARLDGQRLEVGHARQRCVLVALLVDVNRPVPVDRLVDRVWADEPPHRARNALAGYLSRLRSRLDLLQSELVQNEFDDRTADFKDAAAKIRSVNDDLRDTIGDIEKVADTLDTLRRFVVAVDNLVSIVLPLV